MIIYSSTALKFTQDVGENQISERIEQAFRDRYGYLPGMSERHAWNNSMQFIDIFGRVEREMPEKIS